MKKVMLLLISILLLCGCENKKCIKSHKEKSTCIRPMCMPSGKGIYCMPMPYPCEKEICDEYELGE